MTTMAEAARGYPRFANDGGDREIAIGVKEFECMGARPPHDHPHVYLDMGKADHIVCPYCGTLYRHDAALGRLDARPAEALVRNESFAA
jgi:uncharacterized Zn-finger protein